MTSRVLEFEGIHNFRDAGGYPVKGAGRLRRGLLWRSGQHHDASDADLSALGALEIRSVFDLRGNGERRRHPCRRPQGCDATVFLSEDPEQRSAPHLRAGDTLSQRDAASMREGLRRNYETIAFRPELQAMMRRYLAVLGEGQGASLIHCMAGKDRTGIAVAMLHQALGVHRDDIIEDYLLTNSAGDVEARIAAGSRTIRSLRGDMPEAAVRVLMGVEPEYLETAFAAIEARFGSVEAYLSDVLGLDAVLRGRLQAALVE